MLCKRLNIIVLSFVGMISVNTTVALDLHEVQRQADQSTPEFGVVSCALSSDQGLVIKSIHVNGQVGNDSIIPGRTRCLPFLVQLKKRGATIGPPITASIEGAANVVQEQFGQLLTFNLIASGGNARAFLACSFDSSSNGELVVKFLDNSDKEYSTISQHLPCMDVLATLAGGDRRFKFIENNNPFPQDRIFFNYHHFHNAVTDVE